ncbi:MAG: methylenetetrahydrofolate reductase [Gemmatimonadaceae bacterium]|nr:methylenetetrahydrofolate reductase [Gemmatimonadaceae bacterium]
MRVRLGPRHRTAPRIRLRAERQRLSGDASARPARWRRRSTISSARWNAGATRAITQFFFDNALYLRYRDRAQAAGIEVPIVPGIMPVTNFAQTRKFSAMAGASVPDSMARHFDGLEDDADTRKLVAATLAAEQCTKLADEGVEDFHFYTLNRADLAYAICHILGLRAAHHPAQVSA